MAITSAFVVARLAVQGGRVGKLVVSEWPAPQPAGEAMVSGAASGELVASASDASKGAASATSNLKTTQIQSVT